MARGPDGEPTHAPLPPRPSPGGDPAASPRVPLPTDASTLPPLGAAFDVPLDAGLHALGVQLSPGVRAAIEAQARLLVAWSGAVNLSAHRTPERIALEHVLDSLSAVSLVPRGDALLDMGSGAGYPGLPLALATGACRVALVDSIGKKARFLAAAAASAQAAMRAAGDDVPTVAAIAERVEDLAHDPDHRGAWDVVTARAVAATADLVELGLPLLRDGGRLVLWKRDDGAGGLERELRAAGGAMRLAGGAAPRVHRVRVPSLDDHRLVVIVKRRPSAATLPRPAAERRRPLLP